MSDSNEDDGGSSDKPGLEGIMEASLFDDLGGSSVFLDHIVGLYRSWHSCRDDDRPMGRGQDLRAVQMVGQETRPKIVVSTLSGTKT